MNKLANVIYAYSPKNDDELELKVGDRVEVIGFEEEGWWKGRLKGRIGVFPSNFVQVIDSNSSNPTTTQSILSSPLTNTTANKLNIFGGGKLSKTSLSSNSLNSNNSNSNNNINNNSTNNNNNNLMMNNTQNQDNMSGLACSDDPSVISSERRPKPIRGVGYGDIFAAGGVKVKPIPAEPIASNLASERLSTTSITNTLQKQIPKKPPPPAPTRDNGSNGTSTDQAPALPPKPANQFSPHLQQHSRPLPPTQQQHQHLQQQHQHQPPTQQVREQARVIYAYEPANDDELAMEVGDIIDIIDKDIEDAGWWKGELRGKIGVFPDNFVQPIENPDTILCQDWQHHRASNTVTTTTTPTLTATASLPVAPNYIIQGSETKIKSVFATHKGFSKELENNLEKHNCPASFLSLKRNKLQQHLSSGGQTLSGEPTMNENGKRDDIVGQLETNNTKKLNHITANRAKGPSRRPPSNVLNKRNQLDQQQGKRESNGRDDSSSLGSLPINSSPQSAIIATHDTLSSLPAGQHTSAPTIASGFLSRLHTDTTTIATAAVTTTTTPSNPTIKSSLSLMNVVDDTNQTPLTPKTSQRVTQPTTLDKSKTTTSNTPPWMVELKKATAERKRDTPIVNAAAAAAPVVASQEDEVVSSPMAPIAAVAAAVSSPSNLPTTTATTTATATKGAEAATTVASSDRSATVVADHQLSPPVLSNAQYDNLLRQISKNVNSEISELREEVKRLQEDVKNVSELKSILDVMRTELRACQSATENQKRYIKELVNNLADERKKIAAMQTEIDRNLK